MTLPDPYYDHAGITLYHAKWQDVVPFLPVGGGDYALVTDPPYGIDFDYGDAHDDNPDTYAAMMRDLIAVTDRLVGDGPRWVWQAMLNAPRFHEWFPPQWRIFAACKGFVQYRPTPVQFSWDPVVFWGKVPNEPMAGTRDWHVQNMTSFGAGRESVNHPCPRPLPQVRYVVEVGTGANQIVLDPFCGSGTTLRAARETGRRAIGIEQHEPYCQEVVRLLGQLALPISAAQKYEQAELVAA